MKGQIPEDVRPLIWTLPNLISLLRILCVPAFVWAVLERRAGLALWIFTAAWLSDLLDGFTARLFHVRSKLGMILDPAGDKLLMAASYIVLAWPGVAGPNAIPLFLTAFVFLRDLLIVVGALIAFRLWRQTTFQPTLLGKFSTAFQVGTVFLVLLFNALDRPAGGLRAFFAAALFFTVASGVDYFIYGLGVLKKRRAEGL